MTLANVEKLLKAVRRSLFDWQDEAISNHWETVDDKYVKLRLACRNQLVPLVSIRTSSTGTIHPYIRCHPLPMDLGVCYSWVQ
jgi:hypothetical protein